MDECDLKKDLAKLIDILPEGIRNKIIYKGLNDAIEIVLDLGKIPELRRSNNEIEYINETPVTMDDINYVVSKIPPFTNDNRSGIEGTLHRISAIRNRSGKVIGLTMRIGRFITGTIDCIRDIILEGKSILFLGRPGVGKTTKLREIARLLANDLKKRVIIVDTSNEIGGDGDLPHRAIGKARRMMVSQPELQKDVMIEAVQNHTPQVIVVDEVGTEEEAAACRTIAERGVMLIATAHGNTLQNLIKNPTLSDLIGSIESVTLGDDEAKKRSSQKVVLERAKQPSFDVIIEIVDRNTFSIYKNSAQAVDYMLRDWPIRPIIRKIDENFEENKKVLLTSKKVESESDNYKDSLKFDFSRVDYVNSVKKFKKIYIYGVSKSIVEKAIERLNLNCELTKNIKDAQILLLQKSFSRGEGQKILSQANEYRLQIFYVKTNSQAQIQKVLKEALMTDECDTHQFVDETELALSETKNAIEMVINQKCDIELKPQSKEIRRLQHDLAHQYNLESESIGDGKLRHLKIKKML